MNCINFFCHYRKLNIIYLNIFIIQILKQFLELERDHISFVQGLYIRLCSQNMSMHEEAVNLIKEQQVSIICQFAYEYR